ncbi:helix-turn-helix domain-containing protein [Microlunatus ginsengisoli]
MSQETFAEKVGVGVRTVSKWHQHPDSELRPVTAAMLDTFVENLDPGARRRFSLAMAGVSITALARLDESDWLLAAAADASLDALSRSSQVGPEVLPDLIQHVMQIARGYDSASRTAAFRHAQAMRQLAAHLADTTSRPSELADIYLALGQLDALMASLAFDLGSWEAAAQLARASTRYADLAGHTSLHAWTLGLEATLAFWSGDGHRALDLANAALAIAPAGAPRFRLRHIAARAHGVLGDAHATRRVLEQACDDRDTADTSRDELHDVIGGEFAFGDARAAACAGAAWLRLGRGREALADTQRALAFHFSGAAPTSPGVVHGAGVDTAAAFLLQGDVTSAECFLRPVLELDSDPINCSLGGRLDSVAELLEHTPGAAASALGTDVRSWLSCANV